MKEAKTVVTPKSDPIQDVTYNEILDELTIHLRPGSYMNSRRSEKRLVYGRVPITVFHAFLKAESKGGFFNREIKPVYPFLGEVED